MDANSSLVLTVVGACSIPQCVMEKVVAMMILMKASHMPDA